MCEHPPCVICDAPVQRRDGEKRNAWMKRVTCSPEHAAELRGSGLAVDTSDEQPHTCAVCPEPVLRRKGESPAKWRSRVTCCETCARIAMKGRQKKEPMAERACAREGCGKAMRRGVRESSKQWRERRYCSLSCSSKDRKAAARAPSKPPKQLRDCVSCGEPIPWHPSMAPSTYSGRSTCGRPECRAATGGRCQPEPEMKAITADLCLSVTPRQVLAYMSAGDDERRLFAPAVRIAARVLGGGAA